MRLTIEVKEDLIKKYMAIGKKPWIEVTEAEAKEYKSIEYVIAETVKKAYLKKREK